MDAVILAAGRGDGLRPLTTELPEPMVPVLDRPLLAHTLDLLRRQGVRRVAVNLHRFPESKDTDDWGVKPTPGFEVPLKDEERLEYMLWRSDRDVVRNKKDAAPKDEKNDEKKDDKEKKDKEKKPFVDKVLQKALDHLKQVIDKLGPE